MSCRTFALSLLLVLLTACGQRGPLYLPDADAAQASGGATSQDRNERKD